MLYIFGKSKHLKGHSAPCVNDLTLLDRDHSTPSVGDLYFRVPPKLSAVRHDKCTPVYNLKILYLTTNRMSDLLLLLI